MASGCVSLTFSTLAGGTRMCGVGIAAASPAPSTCAFIVTNRRVRMPLRICAAQPVERDYVSYEGRKSVFPAEACDELGGDSCLAEGVGAEVKLTTQKPAAIKSGVEGKDRQYLDYKEVKTVFPGDACDELGGEFCEPDYQEGVFGGGTRESKA